MENDDYAAFAHRILRATPAGGHRRHRGLTRMTSLADDIEAAIRSAVTGLRDHGYSWAEIGSRLGSPAGRPAALGTQS